MFEFYYTGGFNIARPFWFTLSGGPFDRMKPYIRTASLPSVTINPVVVNYWGFDWKLPATPNFNDLSATILCMDDFDELKRLHAELNKAVSWDKNGSVNFRNNTSTYKLKGIEGQADLVYTLDHAWVSSVGDITFDQDNKDSILTFDCSIVYSMGYM